MSVAHPIISITGSSGAGTTSVKKTFDQIFRREKVNAAYIEGDAFHRFNRLEMRDRIKQETERGNRHFSHFSAESNLFEKLEESFKNYSETGTGLTRHYIHDDEEGACMAPHQEPLPIGCPFRKRRTCCSMKACTARLRPTG